MNSNTVIDLAWLESATLEDLKSAMRNPSQLAAVNVLLQTPEGKAIASEMLNDPDYKPRPRQAAPTPEEAAQIAADTALAEQQAQEAAALAAEVPAPPVPVVESAPAAPVAAPVEEEKKKIVLDYQATAEDGTPIGRPTHIEGWSNEEVVEKLKAAHVNAVRYAERMKKNKVASVEARTQQKQDQERAEKLNQEASTAVEEATKEKDPIKLKDAIVKVSKADREAEIARESARAQGVVIANAWMADHKEDFQPCHANTEIIGKWLAANELDLSYENLELAFVANEIRLAKPVQVPVEEVPAVVAANPPAAAPAVVAEVKPSITAPPAPVAEPVSTPAAPASQPAAAAPEVTPVAAPITQSATRKPGVNGGIVPGSLSAPRPQTQPQPQTTTRAELLKEMKAMSSDQLRKKLKNAEYTSKLRAAGIPVASNV
jgi:hypothetical protein